MSGFSYVLYKFVTIHRLENPKDDSTIQFMSEVIQKHTGKKFFLSYLRRSCFLKGLLCGMSNKNYVKYDFKENIIMLVYKYKHISTCSYLTPVCRFDD